VNNETKPRCAWCRKQIEAEDFAIQLILPTPNEEFKKEILSGLFEAPKRLRIKEKAIEVLYQFCSKDHKNQYKKFLESEGVKVY